MLNALIWKRFVGLKLIEIFFSLDYIYDLAYFETTFVGLRNYECGFIVFEIFGHVGLEILGVLKKT